MLLATTDNIPGMKTTLHYGIVRGSSIKTKHLGKDIVALFQNIAGKELSDYSKMMDEARDTAIEKMCKEAESMGANAIVGIRLETANVMGGAAEILAFGTAVIVEEQLKDCTTL